MSRIRHRFASAIVDAGDPTLVGPDEWNDVHLGGRETYVPAGSTSIDEFNDASLDPAWVRVDASGTDTRVSWTETEYGQLVMGHTGVADAAAQLHALLQPISTVSAGDAFETAMQLHGPIANYTMGGLILTDGTTYGAGNQIITLNYLTSATSQTNDTRPFTNFSTQGTASTQILILPQGRLFVRLVCVASTTWRCDVSADGTFWLIGGTATKTITPTHVGFMASSWGAAVRCEVIYDFIRRTTV